MSIRSHARLEVVLTLLAVFVFVGPQAAMATAPGPVIAVKPLDEAGPAEEPEPAQEPEEEPEPGCFHPAASSVAAVFGTRIGNILASYPGPVIGVKALERPGAHEPPCRTDLSLSLEVKSRKGAEPDGADAFVDDLLVPRRTLESGFSTQLPADHRTIELTDPGEEWEVTSVGCTCGGGFGSSAMALSLASGGFISESASYPGPVIPARSLSKGTGATGGAASCEAGAASLGIALASAPATSVTSAYPGPVIGVKPITGPDDEPEPEPTPEPTPEPPTRDPGSVSWTSDGSVDISDWERAGAIVDCRWTVEHVYGHIDIRTITEPSGRERRFHYSVQALDVAGGAQWFQLVGAPGGADRKAWEGTWRAELEGLEKTWKVKSSSCTETDPERPSRATGEIADIGLDPGDHVTCTFRLKLLAPEPGPWTSRQRGLKVSCPGYSESFGPTTDAGTIRVREDGDLVIARGLGGQSTTWRLRRDPSDPLRYSGRVRATVQGATGTFDLDLRMDGERKLVGTFKGKAKTRGVTCRFSSPLTLRYAGD